MKKILYFNATWCGPCNSLKPVIESLKSELEIESIDIDSNPQLTQKYSVKSIPTLVFVKDGHPQNKKSGVLTESQIKETWNNL